MKFAEPMKEVDYHGLKLTVPERCKFIASDADGETWAYESSPTLHHLYWDYCTYGYCIGPLDLEGMDWKETLIEI
jgi:hypothetical protein